MKKTGKSSPSTPIVLGSPQNPAIVFLHGFMGNKSDWLSTAKILSDHYFCILLDLPGHGDAIGLSELQVFDYSYFSGFLKGFLDNLKLMKVNIVGYSMGGRIALHFALLHPEKVASLLLESSSPGIEDEDLRKERYQLDIKRSETILNDGLSSFLQEWYQAPLFSSLMRQSDQLAQLIEKRSNNVDFWMAKILREMSPGLQTSLWPELPYLNCPCLLISGKLDSKYGQINDQVKNLIPHARQTQIAGVGHNCHFEHPAEVARLIKDFLSTPN